MAENERNTNDTYFEDKNSSETYFDTNKSTLSNDQEESFKDAEDLKAGTVINNYIIFEKLSSSGKESNIYLAKKDGNKYAFKLYKRKFKFDNSKMSSLRDINCPYIANLSDFGEYNGYPYEVYDYYENGTLQEYGKVDEKQLKDFINQLNEGLNALHSLSESGSIIHGDIKPSNIFISNDKTHLLIGDFGISSFVENGEQLFGSIGGTPEYAPPSVGVVDKMKKTKAYDYGSLGLVIFFMTTGYSMFANMTTEEIAQAWSEGIKIPQYIDTRIKILLDGLLVFDENNRFGYKKVKDWYDGSFVKVTKPKELFANLEKTGGLNTLWFGVFDNQVVEVSSIPELVKQMKLHWNQAIYKLRDTNFYQFINSLDKTGKISDEIKTIVEENDADSAVFKTIYLLSSDSDIVYKGVNYGEPIKFIEAISKDNDDNAKEIVLKGLFEYYITKMGYSTDILETIKSIMGNQQLSDEIKFKILRFVFNKNTSFNEMKTVDDLRESISNMSLYEIDQLVDNDDFIAWLYSIGLKELAVQITINNGERK